ncbi:MAG TPA: DUF5947 family protein [Puia sp.]|nr:DUF5947 family protein [Puia sp.]
MTTVATELVSRLKKLIRSPAPPMDEPCGFCGQRLQTDHRHMLDTTDWKMVCVCEVCAIIHVVQGRYRLVPQRQLFMEALRFPDGRWQEFAVPVSVAFFVNDSRRGGIVAYYPVAAGWMESTMLRMEAWNGLLADNPLLAGMSPDIEAFLVDRLTDPAQHFIVPMDTCFQLIGTIRKNWKGICGGSEVTDAIRGFFVRLKANATVCRS